MTNTFTFHITDVFGETRYSGNQLATFLNAASISNQEMQQIAREIHFSETTFILSDEPKNGGYDVRIFTPAAEIDFAGHPTLGTAFIIREHIIKRPVDEVVLNLKVGQVPVRFTDDGILWMTQVQPKFGQTVGIERMAPVLNLDEKDFDPAYPIEEVSTGLPAVIIPLTSMDALKRVRIDRAQYDALVSEAWAKVLVAFCPGGYSEEQTLGVRVFPIALGIYEDPATGSGNGCLGAYLVKHRVLGSDAIDIITGQGYEMGRPSSLHIKASRRADLYDIQVGGRVIPVAQGQWG